MHIARSTSDMEINFTGNEGICLVGTKFEPEISNDNVQVVLLLHGGGQTRHSWTGTAKALAARGHCCITLDLRGHGNSDWSVNGQYALESYGHDTSLVVEQIHAQFGKKPIIIGASLGGMAAMLFGGKGGNEHLTALVLVDITPSLKVDGVEKILGFMAAHAREGFATLQDAADVIAKYLPHRARPKDLSGLGKNLRLRDDGRYYWHWDPAFIDSRRKMDDRTRIEAELRSAVQSLTMPVLLVRGRESELVGEAEVADFKSLVPHANVADVSGARHMVAGDKNDIFSAAVLGFIENL